MKLRTDNPVFVYLLMGLLLMGFTATAQESLKCDHCGRSITGQYIISDGKNYHVDCYEDHVALRCALCGEIIEGEYFEDYWGNRVHAEHKDKFPQCLYCRRFISDKISRGMVKYDDGRIVCGICAREMSGLQNILARHGIETKDKEIPLYLVNRNSMSELAEGFHADPLGFAHYEKTSYAGGIITDRSFKIYMLDGLPKYEFISALAHELMHIWLFANAPGDIDAALREGSCNYAAYLVLVNYSGREVQFVVDNLMSDSTPVYGDGFRRVKMYAEKDGLSGWLNYLKSNRLPPW